MRSLVGTDPYLQTKGAQAVTLHDAVQKKLVENHQATRDTLQDGGSKARFDSAAEAMKEPLQRMIEARLQQQKNRSPPRSR